MSAPVWQDLPTVEGGRYEEPENDGKLGQLSIHCTEENKQWDIVYHSNYRNRKNYQKITERLVKKFPTLERFTDCLGGIHSSASLNSHNRIAIAATTNMQLAGHRQGRLDGNNPYKYPYPGYKRELNFTTIISPIWTTEQFWNKEKVPIGREWEEMVEVIY